MPCVLHLSALEFLLPRKISFLPMSSLLASRDLSAVPSGTGGPTPLGFKSEPWERWGNLILQHLQLKEPLFCKTSAGPCISTAFGWVSHPDVDRAQNACECVDPTSTTAQFQRVGCNLSPPSFHRRLGPAPARPKLRLSYWEGCLCMWVSPSAPSEPLSCGKTPTT